MEVSAITWPLALIIIALIFRQKPLASEYESEELPAMHDKIEALRKLYFDMQKSHGSLENELVRVDAKFEGVEAQIEALGLDLLTYEENQTALSEKLTQTTKAANAAALATGFDPSKVTYD